MSFPLDFLIFIHRRLVGRPPLAGGPWRARGRRNNRDQQVRIVAPDRAFQRLHRRDLWPRHVSFSGTRAGHDRRYPVHLWRDRRLHRPDPGLFPRRRPGVRLRQCRARAWRHPWQRRRRLAEGGVRDPRRTLHDDPDGGGRRGVDRRIPAAIAHRRQPHSRRPKPATGRRTPARRRACHRLA